MTIRPAYRELSYSLPIKGGDILRTLQDARAYMLTLGPHREMRNHWQYICQLIIEEAELAMKASKSGKAAGNEGPYRVPLCL
jgi:hypothetical protein